MEDSWEEIVESVREVFEELVPFNKFLGLKIEEMTENTVRVNLEQRGVLVGNYMHGILHGGVISAMLDTSGGLIGFVSLVQKMHKITREEKIARLARFGTIDLRVDYLRPGKGNRFICDARVLRTGNKVVVTRMELHNGSGTLIALGTGTYSSV